LARAAAGNAGSTADATYAIGAEAEEYAQGSGAGSMKGKTAAANAALMEDPGVVAYRAEYMTD
jgi:hypothetical protein